MSEKNVKLIRKFFFIVQKEQEKYFWFVFVAKFCDNGQLSATSPMEK